MPLERTRFLETADLALACALNHWEYTRLLAESAQGYSRMTPSYFAAFSNIPSHRSNGVFLFHNSSPILSATDIHDLLLEFRSLGLPGIFWLKDAPDRPALKRELMMQGCTHGGEMHDMAVDLYGFRAPTLVDSELIEVQRTEQLELWAHIVCEAFGLAAHLKEILIRTRSNCMGLGSPMHNYLLLHDEVAVAAATLVFASNVAGTYCLAVRKEYRNCGYGKVLGRELQRVIAAAGMRYQTGSYEESLTGFYAGARGIGLGKTELMFFE